jgi:hypothetical protein
MTLIIGILLGVGAHWYFTQPKDGKMPLNASEGARETASDAKHTLKETFDSDKIKDELSRTGQVIREKAREAGNAIADTTANARTTATIKAKLIKEESLAAFKIDVDTTDGVVTLSGTVSSYDEIAKAMNLALETACTRSFPRYKSNPADGEEWQWNSFTFKPSRPPRHKDRRIRNKELSSPRLCG